MNNQLKLYLEELYGFQNQAEKLDILAFEEWKENILKELNGNYKARFSNLEFYTIIQDSSFKDDEVPF